MTTVSRDSRAVSQSSSCESQVCQSLETLVGSIESKVNNLAADVLCMNENLKVIDFKLQLQQGNEQVCQNQLQVLQGNEKLYQNKLQVLQGNEQVCQNKLQVLQGNEQMCQNKLQVLQSNEQVCQNKLQALQSNDQVCQNKFQELQGQVLVMQNKLQELQNNFQDNLKATMISVMKMFLSPKFLTLEMCKRNQQAATKYVAVLIVKDVEQTWCDTVTDGGGWVVIQRRISGGVDFNRTWNEYKEGFGSISGDFWLGNDLISQLTMKGYNELRFDMKYKGKDYYSVYSGFKVENEAALYKMRYSLCTGGNVKDDFFLNSAMNFSTKDRDNDLFSNLNCALYNLGGFWWNACGEVNVNGVWASKEFGKEMGWYNITGRYNSLEFVEMKVRLI
ncbi:fibrinogen-like protein A [Physella acuta]|uniref:fibrinogen-like protein A n=1 Tax=Physella acuta TaxID=109671 RepID=UPI0027DBB678|nr:fibrinogen-like protein A [Physella acuta]